jgi:ABC-type multidrug transport system ATPase subunit
LYNTLYIEGYQYWEGYRLTVWSEPILQVEVIFLACEAVAYLLLAIYLKWSSETASMWQDVLDFVQMKWWFGRRDEAVRISASLLPEDEDVILEQDRVLAGHANDDLIVTSQLTKVYNTGKVAVNNLSLGIPPGECFGLLGVNGAGKTTTLAMLTAEFPPTGGDATIAGFSVTHQPEAIRRRVGYCPQFDAHFDNLTGREHVELYASIKGVPKNMIREAAAAKLAEVGLSEVDADRLSAHYSGGMKRRLSLACALIGQPQIVFLDEATTGVDPVARREIWKVISDHVIGDKHLPASETPSIILTTHSMEECEALCPRLGIMANGRLRCLGSPQHLKNKFGKGYQIELKVKGVDRDDADFCEIGLSIQRALGATGDEEAVPPSSFETLFLNLDQVLSVLRNITGDDYLASLVNQGYPAGYLIWKDAVSPTGVSLDELSAFAATELRMKKVDDYMKEWYPDCIVRERQETKIRYEIGIEGAKISAIFANMETNKEDLQLADYGVSGTSLEHVFNTFAAEAEQLKQGCDDG